MFAIFDWIGDIHGVSEITSDILDMIWRVTCDMWNVKCDGTGDKWIGGEWHLDVIECHVWFYYTY